jgi:hypothetical protein
LYVATFHAARSKGIIMVTNALQDDDSILALLHSRMVFVLNKITVHPTIGAARSLRTLPCLVVQNYSWHSY